MQARHRLIPWTVVTLSALLLSVAFPSAGLSGPDRSAIEARPGIISIEGFAFVPKKAYVELGTAVHWLNNDPVAHTVTSDTPLFDSPDIPSGGQFVYTFTMTGTFTYHCAIHPSMHGTIVVFQGPAQAFLPVMLRAAP